MGASSGGGRTPGGHTPYPGVGNFSKITSPKAGGVKREGGGNSGSGVPTAPSNGGSKNPPSNTSKIR